MGAFYAIKTTLSCEARFLLFFYWFYAQRLIPASKPSFVFYLPQGAGISAM